MADDAPSLPTPDPAHSPRRVPLLFLNVIVIAVCGLVYELLAATVGSYLLGDSVTQFSLVIGIYLSSMGIGAWVSRYLHRGVARAFVEVQLLIALVGGTSAPVMFFSFGATADFSVVLYLEVTIIGALVGLELPLLMRLLERDLQFKDLVSRVLALDYAGALFASLAFPLIFVPMLGLVRTSFIMGLTNVLVAAWATSLLRSELRPRTRRGLQLRAAILAVCLLIGAIKAESLTAIAEERAFKAPILYAESTGYQRIVITEEHGGFQLHLNGNLQFDSNDEYRYHESLVHPVFAALGRDAQRVLIMGGGDGLALREVWRHPSVREVTMVDLDPGMTQLANRFPPLAKLNEGSLADPRLKIVNEDAFIWVGDHQDERYDIVIVDFPDPNNYALGKLYTAHFYGLLKGVVAADGAVVVQSTSPLFVARSYWIIITTMESAGFIVRPYQVPVPSFGVWGYALAKKAPFPVPSATPVALRYLDPATMAAMFVMPRDMQRVPADVNRLDNQILVRRYEEEGERWR